MPILIAKPLHSAKNGAEQIKRNIGKQLKQINNVKERKKRIDSGG